MTAEKKPAPVKNLSSTATIMEQIRMVGNKFTHPLLLTDLSLESTEMQPLKFEISNLIADRKSTGTLSDATVYIREMNNGSWISINGSAMYNAGSLIKVVILITYLKEAEKDFTLLNKKIFFRGEDIKIPVQSYDINTLKPGNSYTIGQLLYNMVVYSDNHATAVLTQNIDLKAFQQTFADLDIPVPGIYDINYQISAEDYSKFFRVLYSASYLSEDHSELALNWLSQSVFTDGLVKQLPAGVLVARKFGEFGLDYPKQLHECGIVYLGDNPYMIIVMTRGKDAKVLSGVIADISKLVYDQMISLKN